MTAAFKMKDSNQTLHTVATQLSALDNGSVFEHFVAILQSQS